jgi:hypothetical protein
MQQIKYPNLFAKGFKESTQGNLNPQQPRHIQPDLANLLFKRAKNKGKKYQVGKVILKRLLLPTDLQISQKWSQMLGISVRT